jgi:hypothetical protein
MLITPAIAIFAASTFAAFGAAPSRVADVGIAPTAGKQAHSKPKGKTAKAKRNDKDDHRQIVTYNLFQDPVFKLNGALTDKRQIGLPAKGLGHAPLIQASPFFKPPVGPAKAIDLKLQEPETASIDFGCNDKPFRTSAAAREVTACYKHSVDRSWKAQTYLSREYTEGTQKWGGGLAVKYAY